MPTPTTPEFPDRLLLEDNCDGTFTLLEPFRYVRNPSSAAPEIILAEAGLVTDFASIPRVLHGILPPDGKHYGRAAVIHDFLYSTRGLQGALSRIKCDYLLGEMMRALGARLELSLAFFTAVYVAGASHWPKRQ